MQHVDLVVMGAGPGGLFASREAARRGLVVALVEAQDRAGRKLSMAGGGMGNITNRTLSPEHFVGSRPAFCKSVLASASERNPPSALLSELQLPGKNGEYESFLP